MYEQTLTLTGLTAEQAAVYEALLKSGPSPARKIAQNTPYKRTLVYKILEDLQKLGLVARRDEVGKVSIYEPTHPLKLKELAEKRQEQARNAQTALEGIFGQLTSDFNLISGKPGVKFYEGKEGIIKIYETLLAHGSNIDSIEDKGEMAGFIPEYSHNYPKERVKRNIFNRVIAPSDNPINATSEKEMRETRFIPTDQFPFRMDIKIAGRLVSLITFQKENADGVLVDNEEIAENFRLLFELLWKLLEKPEQKTESISETKIV